MEDSKVRSRNAQLILENPEFERVFDEMREEVIHNIEKGPLDEKMRDELVSNLYFLARLKKKLQTCLQDAVVMRFNNGQDGKSI